MQDGHWKPNWFLSDKRTRTFGFETGSINLGLKETLVQEKL